MNVKTRQCIFIGYGQDEFDYRFYDPVEKKLVRSRDVVFFQDQTIEDFDKADKADFQSSESLDDVDPVPLTNQKKIFIMMKIKLIMKMVIMFRMTGMMLLMLQCKMMWLSNYQL